MRFACFTAALLTFVLDQHKVAALSIDRAENQLVQTDSEDWNDVFQSQLGALRNHDTMMAQADTQPEPASKKGGKAAAKGKAAAADGKAKAG